MKNIFLAIILLMCSRIVNAQVQTYLTWDTPLGNYSLKNSNQGIERLLGPGWSYTGSGTAASVQQIAEGESVTFQLGNANSSHAVFLSSSKPKTFVVDDQNDNATWVGSDATVPFGIIVSLEVLGQAKAFEAGNDVGSAQVVATGNWLRIFYQNATTVLYQFSTNGTSFTTFHTSAGDPSGSYYVIYQAVSQYTGVESIYKTGAAGNQPPSITSMSDIFITLPVSTASVSPTITDSDGSVSSISWAKVGGPSGGSISSPTTAATDFTGLTNAGTYIFRVTATDNSGAQSSADVNIVVSAAGTGGTGNISTNIIPLSDPMIMRHNAGIEDWNFQNTVPVPTAANARLPLTNYFRWNWYEIETAQGVWDWELFDRPIRAAIDNGQTYSFSVMTFNPDCGTSWYSGKPRPYDQGACMTYPLYLHQAMQAEASQYQDWITYAWGAMWVPNYNSPTYLSRVRIMYDSIYNHLNTTYYQGVLLKHVVEYVDNRSYGSWGEAHHHPYVTYSNQWGPGNIRQPTVPSVDSIMAAPVRAFPDVQVIAPFSIVDSYWLRNQWIDPAVAKFTLMLRNASGMRVGMRRDHMGVTDFGYVWDYDITVNNNRGYTDPSGFDTRMPGFPTWTGVPNTVSGPYGIDTAFMNLYREAPQVGEAFGSAVAEETRGEGANFPKEVRFWRYNSFGNGNFGLSYGSNSPSNFNFDSIRLAAKIAGHRLQINGGSITSPLVNNSAFTVSLQWQNVGLTPVYERYHVILELRSSAGSVVWSDTSSFNPRLFLPASTATTVTDNFNLGNIPVGYYNLFIKVKDIYDYRIPLPLAIQGRTSDGSYPLASSIQVVSVGSNQPPSVNITGINSITLPTNSVTFTAAASDPDGTISSYAWTQVSGPSTATIGTPTASSTTLSNLVAGSYSFQVIVTDNGGLTAIANRSVTVSPATPNPVAPSANAGADSIVFTPRMTVTLIGSGTDPDGTIAGYQWTKVSGPPASIVTPNLQTTRVENLVVGSYVFRLTVTDNTGSTGTDDVLVTVVDPAVISAGQDRSTSSGKTTLTATVPAGTTAVAWSKVSAPAGDASVIESPNQQTTRVTNMRVGTYVFRVTATVNGSPVTDDVTVVSRPSTNNRVRSVSGNQ